ncbi:MAG: hypothetical protein M5U25_17705 [Planctomycetota bacterium]|nr:hypothetical protein [Planctomycetota bacterium]
MDAYSAELAYLFRHALLRDAAYDLQPPTERGRLHALALDVIEQLFIGREAELDALAFELARHAELAGRADRECHWLERAAAHAHGLWRGAEAAELFERLAKHPAAGPQARSRGLRGAGKSLLDIGRLQPALELLQRAAHEAPDVEAELDALRPLAYAFRNLGRHEESLAVSRRNAELSRAQGDRDLALALDSVATALTGLERIAEALPVAQEAIRHAEACGVPRVLGGLKANLGVLLGRIGDDAQAVQALRESLAILETTGDRRAMAAARRNLADRMRALGDHQGAIPECETALAEMRALGDRRGEGMALMTLGGAWKDAGRPQEGLRALEQSAELLLESGDLRAAAVALANTASCCLDTAEYARCEQLLARAEELARASNTPRALAMLYTTRGDLRREQQRWTEAAQWYARAHEAYAAIGELEFAAWQLGERAVALKRAGEPSAPQAYEAALAALRADAPADVKYYEDKWNAAQLNDCAQ